MLRIILLSISLLNEHEVHCLLAAGTATVTSVAAAASDVDARFRSKISALLSVFCRHATLLDELRMTATTHS
jgi:hypothetical protein